LGAAAGCAVGHHEAVKKQRAEAAQAQAQNQAAHNPPPAQTPHS
jgi:hypothetical protein